ncbi:MAG: nucleotide exchange factor GrpE [Candidatus Caenarcaniphilales bacterium]|nr:nucleotide exchange factor GrpE [Candidatus Caenarcaniphilales bacterium]
MSINESQPSPETDNQEASTEAQVEHNELEIKCEGLENKVKDLEGQLKRSIADYQNLLRRSQQEREQLRKYAVEPALMAIIPCLDNFYFALKSFNEESSSEQLLESLKMLWTSLLGSLSQIGVKTIDSTGISFDPLTQEAVNQVPNNEVPEGTVVEVFRIGYKLNDRVIRPSQVSVSIASEKAPE